MSHNITVDGGTSVRLPTAGKYCDRDIVITAEGGKEDLNDVLTEQEALIDELQEVLRYKASGNGETTPTQEKSVDIVENGTFEVMPDEGYALSKVTANVNVPIPDGYIQPSGTKIITENGTHDVTDKASVNVNVASSGGGGEVNMNTCTVVVDVPSKTNYYICYEAVSGGAITHNITKHYTDANITKSVRCDSVMNIVAGTIKGAVVTDGEVLRVVSGQGLVYKTPNTASVSVQITLSN